MRLALYQPDIPQNLGAAIRLCACLDVPLEVIGPCGFPLNDKMIRRAAMDYGACAKVSHHAGWMAFCDSLAAEPQARLLLFSTRAATPYHRFAFSAHDILLLGRESAGVPPEVFERADHRLIIPMTEGARSFNVINAASMALGEALRQTNGFPAAL